MSWENRIDNLMPISELSNYEQPNLGFGTAENFIVIKLKSIKSYNLTINGLIRCKIALNGKCHGGPE